MRRGRRIPRLTELTLRSKSYWGYDAELLADRASELRFEPSKFLPDFHVYSLELKSEMVEFCSLLPVDEQPIERHDLFVETASYFGTTR